MLLEIVHIDCFEDRDLKLNNWFQREGKMKTYISTVIAADRVSFAELKDHLRISCRLNIIFETSFVVASLILEVKVPEIARWSVRARTWGLEARVAAPTSATLRRPHILCNSRVEVSAYLCSVGDISQFFVVAWPRTALIFFSETSSSIHASCL